QDGWELVKIYEDPAESGDKFKRPKLQEMLSDACSGAIDVVVTIRLDRISRSVRDFHRILKTLEDHNVDLVSVTQGIDTSTPAGRLLRNILIDFAQFERDMIADRTREKRLARAQKGLWNGGSVPYGYTNQNKRLVVNSEEARVVKFMFEKYAQTKSLALVHRELNLQGLTNRAGKPWQKKSVDIILSNPVYAGKIVESGQYYDGIHEPIIQPDLFFALNKKTRQRLHAKRKTDRVFLLRGLVRCGHHDCALTPYYVKGRAGYVYYYRCLHKQNYPQTDCPVGYTNADRLEAQVVDKLKEISAQEDLFANIVQQVNLNLAQATRPYEEEIKQIDKRIKAIQKEIDNFLEAVGQGGGNVVTLFKKKVEQLQAEQAELTNRKGELAMLIANSPSQVNAEIVLEALKDFSHLFETFLPKERAEYLQRIIRDIIVQDSGITINIYGFACKPPSLGS
ncbi:MAG: recombinase family protein, partial [Deltaproteobacteria bacterium]|nr:recombinase family protein [Deltaproteobacteria bacterium]